MTNCLACGEPTNTNGPPYRCAYCGEFVCADHRLPENHGCSGSRLPSGESAEGRPARSRNLDDRSLPGSTPDSLHGVADSSPDVAVDGSIKSDPEPEDSTSSQSGLLDRVLNWFR